MTKVTPADKAISVISQGHLLAKPSGILVTLKGPFRAELTRRKNTQILLASIRGDLMFFPEMFRHRFT